MDAVHLIPIADQRFGRGDTDHVALYEPHYFKEFVAGKGSQSPAQ